MASTHLETLARALRTAGRTPSRRTLVAGLSRGLAALTGLTGLEADAKKHKKHKHKHKRKCKKKCNGRCGENDGCGGTCGCAGNTVCHDGTCHACTVTCSGSDVSCGLDLSVALEDGGEIYVCPGRYAGNFTITVDGTTLIGAGPGADPDSNTILDGRGNGTVVTCSGQIAVSLAGLRITGGDHQCCAGGGISAHGTDLQVDNFAIVDNRAYWSAGIYAWRRLRLSNGTIERNIATSAGGGIYLHSQESSSIRNVYIAKNEAARGGGVYHSGTTLTVLGCEISENQASDQGGGFYQESGTLTFDEDCRVVENTAGDTGGGIYFRTSSIVQPNGAEIADNRPNECNDYTVC